MIYSDLIDEIRDLGFEDDNAVSEYRTLINYAITRACRLIATTVKAPIGKYVLDLTDESVRTEDGKYNLADLIKDENNNILFDAIERIVVATEGSIDKTFLNYDMEQDVVLVLDPKFSKKLIIYYKERILPITDETKDDYAIQVVYPCEPLVPLLSAHYVWLDDDERKAILYWNEYDQLKQEIEAKAFKLKARVVGGF